MSEFLEGFSSILPPSQQERLKNMLDVDKLINGNTAELEAANKALLERVGKKQPSMILREQSEQTNSDSYNQTMKEILVDLNSLYSESNLLDRIIHNNNKINLSALEQIKTDMKRIERKIESLNMLADNTEGYSSAQMESFINEELRETNRASKESLFVDKDGSSISSSMDANIDSTFEALELGNMHIKGSNLEDKLHVNGNTVAKIEILDQVGEGFKSTNSSYNIDKAIDLEDGSFWGKVILSDEPLKVPKEIPISEHETVTVTGGAICKFRITLPNPSVISQVSIKPYTEHPMEILSIYYSNNENGIFTGNISKYDKNNPIYIDDPWSINFPSVVAKSITFFIRQTNANKNTYIVSKDEVNNRELWSKIAAMETENTLSSDWERKEDLNPVLSQDRIDEIDSTWQLYLDEQNRSKDWFGNWRDFVKEYSVALTPEEKMSAINKYKQSGDSTMPLRQQVEKFEYVYGAYDISIGGKEYQPKSVYVSKPFKIEGNVQQIVLEAEEEHPIFYINDVLQTKRRYINGEKRSTDIPLRRTSIEYYVSASESPRPEDWIPVLPVGQYEVNQEFLLFPNNKRRTKLRFPCDTSDQAMKPFVVYKNEEPLLYEIDWEFSSNDNGEPSFQFLVINPNQWDSNALYTMDYYPDNSSTPNVVDFTRDKAEVFSNIEYFIGTDKNNTIKLQYYPFIDRDQLIKEKKLGVHNYNPIKVTLNPDEMAIAAEDLGMSNFNKSNYSIIGKNGAITSEILSTIDPNGNINDPARALNVTNYSDLTLSPLVPYNPKDNIPTFQYAHEGKKVFFTETFKHDGSINNIESSHGNAIIRVEYQYVVSGIRVKIILRRSLNADTYISPKVKQFTIKCKSLM